MILSGCLGRDYFFQSLGIRHYDSVWALSSCIWALGSGHQDEMILSGCLASGRDDSIWALGIRM